MKALTEAARAINYNAASSLDRGEKGDKEAYSRLEFLTPIAKGWATEIAQEVTALGLQLHGGMGFVEETGAAQFVRDARIITIYEGTTGIQALDLIGRKILKDGGKELMKVMAEVETISKSLTESETLADLGKSLSDALKKWQEVSLDITGRVAEDIDLVGTCSVNYMMLCGTILGGALLSKGALAAEQKLDQDPDFYSAKITTARFYSDHILPRLYAHASAAAASSDLVMGLSEDQF